MPNQNDRTDEAIDAHKKSEKAAEPKQPQHVRSAKPSAAPEVEDAATVLRRFKDKHRQFFEEHSTEGAAIMKRAVRRVFGRKPGPQIDPKIMEAARLRAAGSDWKQLHSRYIPWHDKMPEFTRSLAEAGFQKKVNGYIAKNPRLLARRKKSLPKLRPQLPAA